MNIRARFSLCGSKTFSLKYPKIYFYVQLTIKENKVWWGENSLKETEKIERFAERSVLISLLVQPWKNFPFFFLKLGQDQSLTELKRMFLFGILSQ